MRLCQIRRVNESVNMTLGFLMMTVWTFSKSTSTDLSSIAESSQSIISHSEEPKHEKHDEVEVRTQTRGSRIYRSVGRVRFVKPGRPQYVRLYGQKYFSELYEILHVVGR